MIDRENIEWLVAFLASVAGTLWQVWRVYG